MRTPRQIPSPSASRRAIPLAAAALTLLGSALPAQSRIEAGPYGGPSECRPARPGALGLYLRVLDTGVPALRLEGGQAGQPALIALATARAEVALPTGGTLLLGSPVVHQVAGTFDSRGIFVHPLSGSAFGEEDLLFAQGFQPVTAHGRFGAELSGGLTLTRRSEPEAPPVPTLQAPPVLVEEFAGAMRAGHLEAGLDLALNSEGDGLVLDLGGNLEVPVAPGVTVGGKVGFVSRIGRGEHESGAAYFDVAIGADVAASAGVGVGVAGLGVSKGVGGQVVWRYASTHEVARALRSMAVLLAVHDGIEGACLVLDRRAANIDRSIARARRLVDRVRRTLRSWMPWRDNTVVRRLQAAQDRLRAKRRSVVDRGRAVLGRLVSWVATERIFLDEHVHALETRMTTAAQVSAQTPGAGNAKDGGEWGMANVGASAAAGIGRRFALRLERVPGVDETTFVQKATFTKSISAAAGFGIGVAASGKRVIEVSRRPDTGVTVGLTLDGDLRGALGAVVVGQAGVGGEVVLQLRLRDLLDYSVDAMVILLGDDTGKIARLLRAVPVRFHTRGRYEAGIAIGIGVKVDGVFKGGIGGSAMMRDCGPGFEYEGAPEGNTLSSLLSDGPLSTDDPGMTTRLDEVKGEVARAMNR